MIVFTKRAKLFNANNRATNPQWLDHAAMSTQTERWCNA